MVIQLIGQASAIIALAVGIFLSIYALRYYVSILRVLVGGIAWSGDQFGNEWRIGNSSNSFSSLQLKREPFVSIHIPVYNESRVIERIVKRCASLNYKNYEVIIVDDSSDETVETLYKNCTGVPNVKIIHRANRAGFKGGALNEALRHTDPRAEYICVFDADFVPPPDIIRKMLLYFTNDRVAAVQGYQRHVLNCSENWITRGVSAGFSAEYMISRTALQLLGSMRLISGSVFAIRADVLRRYGWSGSITEDWELSIRLYLDGYKVNYIPFIQAPAECPSKLRELLREFLRWGEGTTFQARKYFWRVLRSRKMNLKEKLYFILTPLRFAQGAALTLQFLSWLISAATGSPLTPLLLLLILYNASAIHLAVLGGLLMERRARENWIVILAASIYMVTLWAWAFSGFLKGLFEREEGGWSRTYKTGRITNPEHLRFKAFVGR